MNERIKESKRQVLTICHCDLCKMKERIVKSFFYRENLLNVLP